MKKLGTSVNNTQALEKLSSVGNNGGKEVKFVDRYEQEEEKEKENKRR